MNNTKIKELIRGYKIMVKEIYATKEWDFDAHLTGRLYVLNNVIEDLKNLIDN